MVEERKDKDKFDNSKNDKQNILTLSSIPKIRNKLESLKIKDRFKAA